MRLLHRLPDTAAPPIQAPMTYLLNNLINVPTAELYDLYWFSDVESSRRYTYIVHLRRILTSPVASPIDKLITLFNRTLSHYIKDDPDGVDVRAKCRAEGVVLDEILVPFPIILGRLAKGSTRARAYLRSTYLPTTL